MGRVRVKYPSLSRLRGERLGADRHAERGNARGLLMLPQLDEEVIVGFEHGDTRRPIVVGSVFNGKDKPGDELLAEEGRLVRPASPTRRSTMHSKKDFEIKSDQNMVVEITQDENAQDHAATTSTRPPATASSRPSSTRSRPARA